MTLYTKTVGPAPSGKCFVVVVLFTGEFVLKNILCIVYVFPKKCHHQPSTFKMLPWSLEVRQQKLLDLLPEGSKVVGYCGWGWVVSFHILWALRKHITSPMCLMLCRWVPMMFCAVLIACCFNSLPVLTPISSCRVWYSSPES